jgi:hypothetical protein
MKRMASGKKKSSANATSTKPRLLESDVKFVLCVRDKGYEASLERNKIYVALKDAKASRDGAFRVIDESGEEYLYSKERFIAISLPKPARDSVLKSASAA